MKIKEILRLRLRMTIVSGGQTGVDRAALDAAISVGIPYGGFIPKGRLSEDGTVPSKYQMTETESADYPFRTEQNVIHSDATLILTYLPLSGGTGFTKECCQKHRKKHLLVDLSAADDENLGKIVEWLKKIHSTVLNIAGPRESKCPGIYEKARKLLEKALGEILRYAQND